MHRNRPGVFCGRSAFRQLFVLVPSEDCSPRVILQEVKDDGNPTLFLSPLPWQHSALQSPATAADVQVRLLPGVNISTTEGVLGTSLQSWHQL